MAIAGDGDGHCKRITEGIINIRLPVVGELIENYIIDKLKQNLDQEYIYFQDSIKRRIERKKSGG
jgi:hypothetical protein